MDAVIYDWFHKIRSSEKGAFLGALISGLAAHGYMIANKLPNHDDMHYGFDINNPVNPLYGMSRWAMPFVCDLSGEWSVPWLIGLICIIFMSISAMFLVRILDMKSTFFAVLTGSLMAVFPSITGTFTYMAIADGYFFAILLSFMSAFFVVSNRKWSFWVSIVCMTLSLGLYQAYLPLCVGVVFLYMIKRFLERKIELDGLMKLTVRLGVIIVLSIAAYFILSKICTIGSGRFDGQYGIPISAIPYQIKTALYNLGGYFLLNHYGVSSLPYAVIFGVMCLAAVMTFAYIVRGQKRGVKDLAVLVFLMGGFAGSTVLIYFMSSITYIHILMKYPFVMWLIELIMFADMVSEKDGRLFFTQKFLPAMTGICAAALIWNYIVIANHTYLKMQLADSQVYGYSVRLIQRIENCDGYSSDIPIVFIGAPSIEQYNSEFSQRLWNGDEITGILSPDIMFGLAATAYNSYEEYLQQRLGWNHKIYREYADFGGNIEGLEKIRDQMTVYPDKGCMEIYDEMLFVRFK